MTDDLPPDLSELLTDAAKEFEEYRNSPAATAAVDQGTALANDLIKTGTAIFFQMHLEQRKGDERQALLAGMMLRAWVETLPDDHKSLLIRVLLERFYHQFLVASGYPGDPDGYLAAHGPDGECLHEHAHD